jgi:hypothetical protein
MRCKKLRMNSLFAQVAKKSAIAMGHPLAFMGAFLTIIAWGLTGPVFGFSDTWQLMTRWDRCGIERLMFLLGTPSPIAASSGRFQPW